jgi:endoglucanase
MDGGTIYDQGLYKLLGRLADENDIPWQTKTRVAGGTDASAIQRSGSGVAVAALSVAVRNIHSPASVAKIDECESQLALAKLFLAEMAK